MDGEARAHTSNNGARLGRHCSRAQRRAGGDHFECKRRRRTPLSVAILSQACSSQAHIGDEGNNTCDDLHNNKQLLNEDKRKAPRRDATLQPANAFLDCLFHAHASRSFPERTRLASAMLARDWLLSGTSLSLVYASFKRRSLLSDGDWMPGRNRQENRVRWYGRSGKGGEKTERIEKGQQSVPDAFGTRIR